MAVVYNLLRGGVGVDSWLVADNQIVVGGDPVGSWRVVYCLIVVDSY